MSKFRPIHMLLPPGLGYQRIHLVQAVRCTCSLQGGAIRIEQATLGVFQASERHAVPKLGVGRCLSSEALHRAYAPGILIMTIGDDLCPEYAHGSVLILKRLAQGGRKMGCEPAPYHVQCVEFFEPRTKQHDVDERSCRMRLTDT